MTFDFDTREYSFSHGKEPRGYGSWAFEFEGKEPVWAPTSTHADAKRWVRQHIRSVAPADYAGDVRINVCP